MIIIYNIYDDINVNYIEWINKIALILIFPLL